MDKKEIQKKKRRLRLLEKKMCELGPLMRGSVVELRQKCGNPNCRCTKGEKHKKYYYSLSNKGKTKIIYLGKSREPIARQYSDNYKTLIGIIDEMTTINMELLKAGAVEKLD